MTEQEGLFVQVIDLLRAGYGVEDIAIKINRPISAVRELVQMARDNGRIYELLGTDRQRNAEALRIMGVRPARQEAADA